MSPLGRACTLCLCLLLVYAVILNPGEQEGGMPLWPLASWLGWGAVAGLASNRSIALRAIIGMLGAGLSFGIEALLGRLEPFQFGPWLSDALPYVILAVCLRWADPPALLRDWIAPTLMQAVYYATAAFFTLFLVAGANLTPAGALGTLLPVDYERGAATGLLQLALGCTALAISLLGPRLLDAAIRYFTGPIERAL